MSAPACPASDTGGHYYRKQDGEWTCVLETQASAAQPMYPCCGHCEDCGADDMFPHAEPCPRCHDGEVTA